MPRIIATDPSDDELDGDGDGEPVMAAISRDCCLVLGDAPSATACAGSVGVVVVVVVVVEYDGSGAGRVITDVDEA
jgi:hypothetical protein